MELLADRDPEEARKLLDPVLEHMMEAVHRYEGTVNQVMGDGIMALFGAPLAHEDHAVRACYAALRMQESVKRYAEEIVPTRTGVRVQIRVGLNSGEVVVRAIGSDLHMDYTARRPDDAPGRADGAARRRPARSCSRPTTLQLAEGYVEVTRSGPVRGEGAPEPVEVYELVGAGRGPLAPARGGRARADPLRRPRRRGGAARARRSSGPRPGTARSSRWSASPASASRGSTGSSPTPIASQGWLHPRERLGLLRQGHAPTSRSSICSRRTSRSRGATSTRRSARR